MRWTISKRLGIGFGVLLLLAAGVGAIGVRTASQGVASAAVLSDVAGDVASAADLRGNINEMRIYSREFMRSGSESSRDTFRNLAQSVRAAHQKAVENLQYPEAQKGLEELTGELKNYNAAMEEYFETRFSKRKTFDDGLVASGRKLCDHLEKLADDTSQEDHQTSSKAYELLGTTFASRVYSTRYYFMGNEADQKKATAQYATLKEAIQASIANATKPELKQRWEQALQNLGEIEENFAAIVSLNSHEFALEKEKIAPLGRGMSEHVAATSRWLDEYGSQQARAVTASLDASRTTTLGLAFGSMAFGAIAAVVIARSIIRPLRAVTLRLKDIAQGEGDLTQRVDENRSDELGEMATYFNQFAGRIQDLVRQVGQATRSVASASTEIAASAEQMASGMKCQTDQTAQVSAAVEEMSQSVVEVARKSSDAATFAENSGRDATTGGQVVSQTVLEMKGIANQVNDSASVVSSLGRKSEEIGQIISVINDIADQTNLLALNAAIEAARAGEHGRGFAVVADEVRKLAERTTQATEEVSRSIREIQNETGTAVSKMQAGTQKVTAGVQLATSAGDALSKITASSEGLRSMVQSIAAAAEQQSAASEQISRSVAQISAVTRESAEGASQSASAASQLSSQAELLQSLVGRFKV
jgi:hypothetical protein